MASLGPYHHTNSPSIKLQQRLHFLLSSLESSDAADRALESAHTLLLDSCGDGAGRPQARQALLEVLKGLDACSKRAARLRLQLALSPLLGSLERQQLANLVPAIVKQALACLSAHRRDAGVAQALVALMGEVARRFADEGGCGSGSGGGGASPADEGRWMFEELLLPFVRSTYKDPEASRVAAGSQVLGALIAALAPAGRGPPTSVALRAGLAAALEHMWAGSAARRVSAAYAPLAPWVAAVGGGQLGAEGARRLAAICCRGAADKEAWQVRREALVTLASLVATVQADGVSCSGAAAPTDEQAAGDASAALSSGALAALSAQRPKLVAALDSCRYDQIAAVRLAAAEARAAVLQLAEPPSMAASAGSEGGAPAGNAITPPSGKARRRRSPLKAPAAVSAARLFKRPELLDSQLLDFGVQVFAPPSPPRRMPQGQADADSADANSPGAHPDQDAVQPADLRRSVDAASQAGGTEGLPPPWLHRLREGAAYGAAHAAAAELAAAQEPPDAAARLHVSHHVHGRVEIVVGSPAEMADAGASLSAAAAAAGADSLGASASDAAGCSGSPVSGMVARVLQQVLPGRGGPGSPLGGKQGSPLGPRRDTMDRLFGTQHSTEGGQPSRQREQWRRPDAGGGLSSSGGRAWDGAGALDGVGEDGLGPTVFEAGDGAAAGDPAEAAAYDDAGAGEPGMAGGAVRGLTPKHPSPQSGLVGVLSAVQQTSRRVDGLLRELSARAGDGGGVCSGGGGPPESGSAAGGELQEPGQAPQREDAQGGARCDGSPSAGASLRSSLRGSLRSSLRASRRGEMGLALSQLSSRIDSLSGAAEQPASSPGRGGSSYTSGPADCAQDGGGGEAAALSQLRSSLPQLHTLVGLLEPVGDGEGGPEGHLMGQDAQLAQGEQVVQQPRQQQQQQQQDEDAGVSGLQEWQQQRLQHDQQQQEEEEEEEEPAQESGLQEWEQQQQQRRPQQQQQRQLQHQGSGRQHVHRYQGSQPGVVCDDGDADDGIKAWRPAGQCEQELWSYRQPGGSPYEQQRQQQQQQQQLRYAQCGGNTLTSSGKQQLGSNKGNSAQVPGPSDSSAPRLGWGGAGRLSAAPQPWSSGGRLSTRPQHPEAQPGSCFDSGVAAIEDGGELLMALSWRLQRLARGFGHQEEGVGGLDSTPASWQQQQQEHQQQQQPAIGGGSYNSGGGASAGSSQPCQTWHRGSSSGGAGTSWGGMRFSTPRPGAAVALDLPMALPLPGGLMPPPQSMDDGEDGRRELGFELEGLQQELQQHAQQPLGTLLIGRLVPEGSAAGAGMLSSAGGAPSEGGADAEAAAVALPPAAVVMLRERWEEEAERRAWRVCSEQVDFVLRTSCGGVGTPASPGRPSQAAGSSAGAAAGEGGGSPLRRCWALQQAAAASVNGQHGAWAASGPRDSSAGGWGDERWGSRGGPLY